jgi:hypothetical protein
VALENEDSSGLLLVAADPDALDDSESVIEAGGSSPQLGLAGDSGFDVLVAGETGEESDILLVDEEKTDPLVHMAAVEFELEPSPQTMGDDDSESSSQVIAIDVALSGEAHSSADPFDNFEGFGFDSGIHSAPAAATSDPLGAGTTPSFDAFAASAATTTTTKKAVVQEEEYSTGMLIALISLLAVMLLPGLMFVDMMVHMWSWSDPFILNSVLMGAIAGLFGL